MGLWNRYSLKMTFTVPICGGVPRSKDVLEAWIASRTATEAKHRKLSDGIGPTGRLPVPLEQVEAEMAETASLLEADIDRQWVGFAKDDTGLFVRGGAIRAHLKSCSDVLGDMMKKGEVEGVTAVKMFRDKMVKQLYVEEERVYLRQSAGAVYTEPSGYRDATMTVMTAQGPRTCLKRIDFCFPCELSCMLLFLQRSGLGRRHLELLLEYGCVQGFNQDRSLQFGRYAWSLTGGVP